jgi:gamma-polyglutamate biosynthesis protein CapA
LSQDNKNTSAVKSGLILAGIVITAILVFLSWKLYVDSGEATEAANDDFQTNAGVRENTETRINNPKSSESIEELRILFLGDMMLDRYIRQMAERNHDPCYNFSLVKDFLKNYDLVIVNNEGTITGKVSVSRDTTPEQREHYRFTFSPEMLRCYRENNIGLVSLANNHILDFGKEGLGETENNLNKENIRFFGDPTDISRNFSEINIPNGKMALVAYNQFFGASPEEVVDQIRELKQEGDKVIVYCHWGEEYKNISDQKQNDLARRFIDNGADAVIGSHPHVIQNDEAYKNKPIYYSLGNFIFDQYFSPESKRGVGIELTIKKDDSWSWKRHYFENNNVGQVKYLSENK